MTGYRPPVDDILAALDAAAGLAALAETERFAEAGGELARQVVEEGGRMAAELAAPLDQPGDRTGARFENGVVRMPEGFADIYRAYREAGWNGIAADPAYGGGGLPFVLALAVQECWTAANMAFSLCPMLNQGAIEALSQHGSPELKARYLPKLVSGEWTGTMCLTEPQAGSDVGALKTRAEPAGDGSYRLFGQKIFITYGEHDMAENIIHLVLARLPDAPAGTKGISLFLVPKFLPDADGRPAERNDVVCLSIEHKLGIHASPTCVMGFGERGEGAVGFLVGQENRGMRHMFTMMNHARINVGLQGVAIAERAFQRALAFARERLQGRDPVSLAHPAPIIAHADVRRMMMRMKALTLAARAIVYHTGSAVDRAHALADPQARAAAQMRADLLTPVAKAFSTDIGVEAASLGIQVHGGMGYIEETGAAQHLRDARIAPIYEGTNGIQAMDLVTRKIPMADGGAFRALAAEIREEAAGWRDGDPRASFAAAIRAAADRLEEASTWVLTALKEGRELDAHAAAAPLVQLYGGVVGAWLLAREPIAADAEGAAAMRAAARRFFIAQILPEKLAQWDAITAGADVLYALPAEGWG